MWWLLLLVVLLPLLLLPVETVATFCWQFDVVVDGLLTVIMLMTRARAKTATNLRATLLHFAPSAPPFQVASSKHLYLNARSKPLQKCWKNTEIVISLIC